MTSYLEVSNLVTLQKYLLEFSMRNFNQLRRPDTRVNRRDM